ncbi:MAG: DHH family phosphoesterase [Nanoarchaeota archaeon]
MEVIDRMDDMFSRAAQYILGVIDQRRPIMVRHHNDADGLCAAVALERAIMPILEDKYKDYWYRYYDRRSSRTPFYSYADATRDADLALTNQRRFDKEQPLLIILDNGSSESDLEGIRKFSVFFSDILVIDHHFPGEIKDGKCAVDGFVRVHVNPHLVGVTEGLSSGILAAEIAKRMGAQKDSVDWIAAVSAIADKAQDQVRQSYIASSGKDQAWLERFALALDFEAFQTRFMHTPNIFSRLFGEDNQSLLDVIVPLAEERIAQATTILKAHCAPVKRGDITVLVFDVESVSARDEFPPAGKLVGLAHRLSDPPRITAGVAPDFIVFRADGVPAFDVNALVSSLRQRFPAEGISGGGHAVAGALRFIPAAKEKVLQGVNEYIESLVR